MNKEDRRRKSAMIFLQSPFGVANLCGSHHSGSDEVLGVGCREVK